MAVADLNEEIYVAVIKNPDALRGYGGHPKLHNYAMHRILNGKSEFSIGMMHGHFATSLAVFLRCDSDLSLKNGFSDDGKSKFKDLEFEPVSQQDLDEIVNDTELWGIYKLRSYMDPWLNK